jgi:hypothetical protein
MKVVHKFTIGNLLGNDTTIMLPVGAVPIHADMQGGDPWLWVLLDPDEKIRSSRFFRIVGTGEAFSNGIHVLTFTVAPYVFHVFEMKLEEKSDVDQSE